MNPKRLSSGRAKLLAALACTCLGLAAQAAQDETTEMGSHPMGTVAVVEDLDGTDVLWSQRDLKDSTWTSATAKIDFGSRRALKRWGAGAFEVTLHTGDRVLGTMASGSEESLGLSLIGSAQAEFAVEEIGTIIALENLIDRSALTAPESGDRLWRITPGGFDPLDGFLLGFSKTGVTLEGELGTRTTAWAEVACLWIEALEEVDTNSRVPDDAGRFPVSVDLIDGSRLRGFLGAIGDDKVSLARSGNRNLQLDFTSILTIALDDQRQSFLSDRKWTESVDSSLFGDEFGMSWPALADRSVTGDSLKSGGRVWPRGLGVHAPSTLTFSNLSGGILRGTVAIDDSVLDVPAKGSVTFHIDLDGTTVWSSQELTSGDEPVALPAIPIAEAKTLTLRVEEASNSFIGDRANWLSMRIVKP